MDQAKLAKMQQSVRIGMSHSQYADVSQAPNVCFRYIGANSASVLQGECPPRRVQNLEPPMDPS